MEANEKDFYCFLIKSIDIDLFKKGLKVNDLHNKSYIISRQTYFNIQSICRGNKNAPRVSFTTMNILCEYLGIKIIDLKYVYKRC